MVITGYLQADRTADGDREILSNIEIKLQKISDKIDRL